MTRSTKKGAYINDRLQEKVQKAKLGQLKGVIKTWARSSTITPEMIGLTFGVHNGKVHVPVLVNENMVGHKLGEFSLTRKFIRHGGKIAKEQETAAAEAASASKAAIAPAAPAKK